MYTGRNISFLSGLFLLLLICSCSAPDKDYEYKDLNRKGFDTRDTLSYTVSLSDSLSVYDIFLCSRLSPKLSLEKINLLITAVSPSGKQYCETIEVPVNKTKNHGLQDIEWHYRTNIIPNEYGDWKLSILFLDGEARNNYLLNGIYGLGVYCKKNERKK